MKNTNLFIKAIAAAAITFGLSSVSDAQVFYNNQGVPIQQGSSTQQGTFVQGSGTVVGAPQAYQTTPTYYNVEMNEEQKAKPSVGASFTDTQSGVLVRSVFTNGPAQQAGLNSGDLVMKANGKPVQNSASFEAMIGGMKPGDMVSLTKFHDGEEKEVQVKLMTMGQIIQASTVPEAGPFDRAAQQGEQEVAAMRQQIKNSMAELEDMKKRLAAQEQRVADLKTKAKDARMKADEMKKAEEANRKKRMEAVSYTHLTLPTIYSV